MRNTQSSFYTIKKPVLKPQLEHLFKLHAGILIIWIGTFVMASSCFYDSEEYLYPQIDGQCDTVNVSYSVSVRTILQANCYGCHSNATASFGNNIRLEDYADVKVKATDGTLLGSVNQTPGYVFMPLNALKLDACKITIIRKWIDSGMQNN